MSTCTSLQTLKEWLNASSRSAAVLLTLGSNARLGLVALSLVKVFCLQDEDVD